MRALTFGPPVFETPIARIEPDAEVLFGLLLYVSAADPRGVSRDELSRIIWPSATTEQGRHSLRQALYRLRQLGVPIHLRAGLVSIEENDTEIDLRELLHGPIDRSELVRIGTQSFLPGYSPQLGRAYLEWVDELRDRAASVRRRALAAAIVDARAQARFGDIPELARALLALDPLNETATLSLAEALVMDGSKVDALMLLDRYESEVGEISEALRIPVRTLRRRVSEGMDDALMPLRFEVPFVGRVREFGELRDAWAGTRRNVGQCAVVTGEAGIGKTRTSTELLRLAVLDGGLVVTYSCGAGDTVAPLSSLLGLTGMLLNQPGALGCGQEHLNYLRRLLHPDPQQPLSTGMTADLAYAQLVYSLSELVAAITEEAPLVIFIDDAHRLHQTSWRIFTDVTNRLPERSLLLLLAA
ncbi:MAG: AAA family ATPase, partial [Gemmatimonadetes bacterium]|nr:AAA family ATPase [Gemmatimonadota bacterium]